MFDKTTSRAQTTVNVRRALIRHWIDLDQIIISPTRNHVRVSGRIETIQRDVDPMGMASLLTILEEEIRRCKGVDRVIFDLENWTKNSEGEWIETDKNSGRAAVSSSSTKGTMLVVRSSGGVESETASEALPPPPTWGEGGKPKRKRG